MREEDKAFKNALAIYLDDSNLWEKIATAVPGRIVEEIKIRYEVLVAEVNAIELGLIPFSHYADSFKESRKLDSHVAIDRRKNNLKKFRMNLVVEKYHYDLIQIAKELLGRKRSTDYFSKVWTNMGETIGETYPSSVSILERLHKWPTMHKSTLNEW
ncbi:unnamed protein product [Coffea canephora]|uniref:Myb-like domain-containing protein n=1 Tax=Coffea canephora TaxID=49390 RepID=A0A068TZR2_COFCA|nr:unnamed protein product [Coffea canephora]